MMRLLGATITLPPLQSGLRRNFSAAAKLGMTTGPNALLSSGEVGGKDDEDSRTD